MGIGSLKLKFGSSLAFAALFIVAVWQFTSQPACRAQSVSKSSWDSQKLGDTLLPDPVWVYNNWSSYDELSDNIPLTEQLAMR
jgi:hypothetical protein